MIARLDSLVLRFAGLWPALALMLVLALPGFFSLPPVDRDEVLFAQASSQMLSSGDFIDIRFADTPRYKKPVGIYWLQAASAALTGQPAQIWSYRLVSLLGALISVGFTYRIARLVMPVGPAMLAAVALAASLLLGAEARLAKTDAMLLACTMAGQYVLARAWFADGKPPPGRWLAMGFWVAQAAAILIKGPIGPIVAGFTLLGLSLIRRDLALVRALRPLAGLALLVVMVVPWFVAITLKSHGDFWAASLGRDMLAKLGNGQESHGQPPGFYLALVWGTFWPGSLLLAAGLPALWRGRREAVMLLALVWVVPVWLVFELTATKLVHYVLPTYPALTILSAWALWRAGPGRAWATWLMAAVPFALLAGLAVTAHAMGLTMPWPFWLGAVAMVPAVALILAAYRRAAFGALSIGLAAGAMALSGAVYPSLARLDFLWPAKPLADMAAANPTCPLIVAGYSEPSLVFLTQGKVRFVPVDEAVAFAGPGCALIALPQIEAGRRAGVPVGEVNGLNLGSGRVVDLAILRVGGP